MFYCKQMAEQALNSLNDQGQAEGAYVLFQMALIGPPEENGFWEDNHFVIDRFEEFLMVDIIYYKGMKALMKAQAQDPNYRKYRNFYQMVDYTMRDRNGFPRAKLPLDDPGMFSTADLFQIQQLNSVTKHHRLDSSLVNMNNLKVIEAMTRFKLPVYDVNEPPQHHEPNQLTQQNPLMDHDGEVKTGGASAKEDRPDGANILSNKEENQ